MNILNGQSDYKHVVALGVIEVLPVKLKVIDFWDFKHNDVIHKGPVISQPPAHPFLLGQLLEKAPSNTRRSTINSASTTYLNHG